MSMENNKLKATKEQAERLDFVISEMDRIKNGETSELKYYKLLSEYDELMSNYDWSDEVFEENGKKGLKNVKGEVVVPAIYDNYGILEPYYLKLSPVVAQLDGKVALVERDGKGTPYTDFEYHYIEPILFSNLYAVWKKEDLKHFALMVCGVVITPYEIDDYGMPCDGVIPLAANGKKGLLAEELGLIYIKPEYDEVYDEGVGSDFIFVKDGVKGRVTLDKQFISDDDFNKLSTEEQDDLSDAGFIRAPDI